MVKERSDILFAFTIEIKRLYLITASEFSEFDSLFSIRVVTCRVEVENLGSEQRAWIFQERNCLDGIMVGTRMGLANKLLVLSRLRRFLLLIKLIFCWIRNGSGVERCLKDDKAKIDCTDSFYIQWTIVSSFITLIFKHIIFENINCFALALVY